MRYKNMNAMVCSPNGDIDFSVIVAGNLQRDTFAGPSGIRVGWGIEINDRFQTEMPPASVGLPSGGWAVFLTPMHPLYSTRPHGLVQAIFWHMCPDLDLGPWYCLPH